MARRVVVSAGCSTPCAGCGACGPGAGGATLADVEMLAAHPALVLGGGDATRWPHLDAYLEHNRASPSPQEVVLEAPVGAVDARLAGRLAESGVRGVVLHAGLRAPVEEILASLELAEAAGLVATPRVSVRAADASHADDLARRRDAAPVTVEIVEPLSAFDSRALHAWDRTIVERQNVRFATPRRSGSGYLPPCALPDAFDARPEAWGDVLRDPGGHDPVADNRTFAACDSCALAARCSYRWDGARAAPPAVRPITRAPDEATRGRRSFVPPALRISRQPAVACVTPWTTLEITNVEGYAHQCCSTWTVGDRGNVFGSSLGEVWNGEGFRFARRTMGSAVLSALCNPICPWLASRRYAEGRFEVHPGSEPFVRNQLRVADDIAERRETATGLPLYMAICAGTYCNYDCIMCLHGRTPRRDLPDAIWDEIPSYLPTLRTLTLLGGEPLANPLVMRFLREFDRSRWPDARVNLTTNGSLLTAKTLAHLEACTFGDVAISLNAGTPEVYASVQRGVALDEVLANIDALREHRRATRKDFAISVVFVVQTANAHTLVDFGRLAHGRGLGIRLLPLNPRGPDGLDFYDDVDAVAGVLHHLDGLSEYSRGPRPEWAEEIAACREAIRSEAASRRDPVVRPPLRRLPLAH